jgi:hypothetical protein
MAYKIRTTTSSKKVYKERWKSYINPLWALSWTPSKELGKEVADTIDKLDKLVDKVADDKWKAKEKK